MISVIIATKDRSSEIKNTLLSLLKGAYKKFEIIIIDQSIDSQTREVIEKLKSNKIQYIQQKTVGKSKALNTALKIAKGNIFAFTDDDCIVSQEWLKEICNTFKLNSEISAVFGRTLPYNPSHHTNQVCPSTFEIKKSYKTIVPIPHFEKIGYGNNMSIKKSVFDKIGNFKTWLGPGSIGISAEDAEISLRILTNKLQIYHNSKLVIYHNRWLSQNESNKLHLSYICGEMACYGYFMFSGFDFAKQVVSNNLTDSYHKFRMIIKRLIQLDRKQESIEKSRYHTKELFYRAFGLSIGAFYSLIDRPQLN